MPGVRNLHPACCSSPCSSLILWKLGHSELQEVLHGYLARMEKLALPEPRHVEIPVCYGGEYGPDLKDVAETYGVSLTENAAIELHSSTNYVVYFWDSRRDLRISGNCRKRW